MKILKVGDVDVLLDDDDWLRLCKYSWVVKDNGRGHKSIARCKRENGKRVTIYIHREVMNTPKGMDGHHKEGNTFDNRKEMLENLTKEEHMRKDRKLAFNKECEKKEEVPF